MYVAHKCNIGALNYIFISVFTSHPKELRAAFRCMKCATEIKLIITDQSRNEL